MGAQRRGQLPFQLVAQKGPGSLRVGEQIVQGDDLPGAQVNIDRAPLVGGPLVHDRPGNLHHHAEHILRKKGGVVRPQGRGALHGQGQPGKQPLRVQGLKHRVVDGLKQRLIRHALHLRIVHPALAQRKPLTGQAGNSGFLLRQGGGEG